MAYEFTKQKIAAERKALARRLAVSGLAGAVGLALGVTTNDMASFIGMFCASVVGAFGGLGAWVLQKPRN